MILANRRTLRAMRSAPAPSCAATGSQRVEETVVIGVRADPEPNHVLAVSRRQGSVPKANARGPDALDSLNWLESQAWMAGIRKEPSVCFARSLLNILWQSRERVAELPRCP